MYYVGDSTTRAVTNCIPPEYLNRFGRVADELKHDVKEILEETESVEEANWTNIALSLIHVVFGAVNAYGHYNLRRKRRAQTNSTALGRARRGRDSSPEV